MTWTVIVTRTAQKQLAKLPAKDRERLVEVVAIERRDDGTYRRR